VELHALSRHHYWRRTLERSLVTHVERKVDLPETYVDLTLGRVELLVAVIHVVSEQVAQLVGFKPCIRQDARQRPALQLAMERHRQENPPIRAMQANMAAALASDFPA